MIRKLYLAGPLFTTAERDFNAALARDLRELGYLVFLPQESEQRPPVTAGSIFDGDVAGIDWADAVVGNMDGPDPDSGTCWECGSVFRRKPVIVYRTDIRDETPFGPFNLMMHVPAAKVLDCKWRTVAEVASMIDDYITEYNDGFAGNPPDLCA